MIYVFTVYWYRTYLNVFSGDPVQMSFKYCISLKVFVMAAMILLYGSLRFQFRFPIFRTFERLSRLLRVQNEREDIFAPWLDAHTRRQTPWQGCVSIPICRLPRPCSCSRMFRYFHFFYPFYFHLLFLLSYLLLVGCLHQVDEKCFFTRLFFIVCSGFSEVLESQNTR